MVDIADPLGNIGCFRMNHLYPPFNDVRARRAILMAMSQEDYMRAIVGDDNNLWKPMPGFFTPGTPLYNEEGGDILKGPRNLDAAKQLLAERGYAGQPVTCLVAQDQPITKAQGDVTADLLKRLGMKVDFAAIDWGTVGARRAAEDAARPGRLADVPHLACRRRLHQPGRRHRRFRANGDNAWFGWPNIPEVEAEIAAWYDAKTLDEEKAAIAPAQQGRARQRRLCADRLLPGLPGLAQERHRASSRARCPSSGGWQRRSERGGGSDQIHV